MNIVSPKGKERFYFVEGISPFANQMNINYSLEFNLKESKNWKLMDNM